MKTLIGIIIALTSFCLRADDFNDRAATCSGVVTGPMSGNYVQLKCIDRALKTHIFRSGPVRL